MACSQGSFFYTNGDIYSGEWKAGKKHGEGTYFAKLTTTKLRGTYEHGVLTYGAFTDKFGSAAWANFTLGSAPARPPCLLRARLAAVGSSALPGKRPDH